MGISIATGIAFRGGKTPEDRLFRGQAESVWIAGLKYNDHREAEEWRKFGEEGVQVLIRGYQHAVAPDERRYRRVNRRLPQTVRKFLPEPRADNDQERRQCIVSLLGSLGKEARSAVPIMIDASANDESESVRQSAIGFFISFGDDNVNKLTAAEKKALVPALLSAMENTGNFGMRGNAAIVLKYMREHADTIVPVLRNALNDPVVEVRLYAADALNCVAPEIGKKAGATELLVELSKSVDTQIASMAIPALKNGNPDGSVPALIECLKRSNDIACEAVWALEWAPKSFDGHAEAITVALTEATKRKDSAGTYAAVALRNRASLRSGRAAD